MTIAIDARAQSETLPWYKIFLYALFLPSIRHYEQIIADRKATLWNGIWLAVGSMLLAVVLDDLVNPAAVDTPQKLVLQIVSTVFVTLVGVLISLAWVWSLNQLMVQPGSQGNFAQAFFLLAAPNLPFVMVFRVLRALPFSVGLSILAGLYLVGLMILAVKTVYRQGWLKSAFLSVTLLGVSIFLLVVVALVFFIVLAFITPAG